MSGECSLLLFPSGLYAVMWMLCSLLNWTRSSWSSRGCASIWLATFEHVHQCEFRSFVQMRKPTGQTPVASAMPLIWSIEKFETPMALTLTRSIQRKHNIEWKAVHTLPVFRSAIMAFHVSTKVTSVSRITHPGLFGSSGSKPLLSPGGNATGQCTTAAHNASATTLQGRRL